MVKYWFVIPVLFMLASCSDHHGNKVVGGELGVYYFDDNKNNAEAIALFWKNNDLLTGRSQDLQLIEEKDNFVLKLIAIDKEEDVSLQNRQLLLKLQKSLNDSLQFSKYIELELADNNFNTIYNIND